MLGGEQKEELEMQYGILLLATSIFMTGPSEGYQVTHPQWISGDWQTRLECSTAFREIATEKQEELELLMSIKALEEGSFYSGTTVDARCVREVGEPA